MMTNHGNQSKDEVDFVLRSQKANLVANQDWKQEDTHPPHPTSEVIDQQQQNQNKNGLKKTVLPNRTNNNCSNDVKGNLKASLSTLDRLSLFAFSKKINNKTNSVAVTNDSKQINDTKLQMTKLNGTIPQDPAQNNGNHHKFVKAASIARLLGNTYNTKKFEKELAAAGGGGSGGGRDVKTKFNTFSGGRRKTNAPYMERFKKYCKEEEDLPDIGSCCHGSGGGGRSLSSMTSLSVSNKDVATLNLESLQNDNNKDLSAKAFRTISRGLGKLWWKRTHSVDISNPDPEFKVSYLGNVLTGWAKGEGCVEKQLNTLWRNYQQNNKPDVIMKIKVCASGLKATTRQHGLTEYWANRITHCCAPKNFPRIFCWIYRHEGRKLKHELRCHAILCSKEKIVQEICSTLKENLDRALRDFKREKILKQNARLSLANSAYDNPSLPRRKILLSVGGNNYRPPLERSKSAPKLMAIEEAIGEEDGDEVEDTNEPEMKACCQKDSLYPAMTLGRRRCRRGHSIRRTGKTRPNFCETFDNGTLTKNNGCCNTKDNNKDLTLTEQAEEPSDDECKKSVDLGSDEDDYDKLLIFNNYNSDSPLAGELLPYFDLQMIKNTNCTSLTDLSTNMINEHDQTGDTVVEEHPNYIPSAEEAEAETETENEECCQNTLEGLCTDDEDEEELSTDELFFRQTSLLNMLHRNSMRKIQHLSMSSEESSLENQGSSGIGPSITVNRKQLSMDSDEGSISSGCETASTVTANADDLSLKFRHLQQQRIQTLGYSTNDGPSNVEAEEHCQRNSNDELFCSKVSLKLQQPRSPFRENNRLKPKTEHDGSDSECSDESGYVEYQDVQKTNVSQRTETGTSTAV